MAMSRIHYKQSTSTSSNEENTTISEHQAERSQTSAILYEFLGATVENDTDGRLSHLRRIRISEELNSCIRREDLNPNQISCTDKVVQILRLHGERLDKSLKEDKQLQQASRNALEETDSDQSTVSRVMTHLKDVINKYFAVDDNGNDDGNNDGNSRKFTFGGICAVFMYCYSIFKEFILANPLTKTIVPWLIELGTCLVVNFARAKFFEWLEQRGGWLKALIDLLPPNPISKALLGPPNAIPNNLLLVVGVAMIGIWAYNRYIR